ncbi:hypothetical protein E7X19_26435, partial [Bacteroides fragilis]
GGGKLLTSLIKAGLLDSLTIYTVPVMAGKGIGFVVSHYDTNVTPDCGVEFLTEEPLQRVYELKQETDMLVVGGGKLLTSLIKAGLLDSLTIYTVPVMAGKGIGF